jgi:hypothetical protein
MTLDVHVVPFETIWQRITSLEGETFTQIRGGEFTFKLVGTSLALDRTNQVISRDQFEQAAALLPFTDTQPLQHLRGPSYLFAILTDRRVRKSDW